jgi:hypothetical protein
LNRLDLCQCVCADAPLDVGPFTVCQQAPPLVRGFRDGALLVPSSTGVRQVTAVVLS